jgi:predicted nucleic-acid-binding protein
MFFLNKNRIYQISILLFLIISLILGFIALPFFNNVDNLLKDSFLQRDKDLNSLVATNFYKNNPENKTVISKFDIISPVYSLLFNYSKEENTDKYIIKIVIYKLKRVNIIEFKVDSLTTAESRNLSFSEAVSLASKYDLSQTNPDPQNITVFEPPTQTETDSVKKTQDVYSNPDYIARNKVCQDKYNKDIAQLESQKVTLEKTPNPLYPEEFPMINMYLTNRVMYEDKLYICQNKIRKDYSLEPYSLSNPFKRGQVYDETLLNQDPY